MITRTIKQIKVFDIKSREDFICGHGYSDRIPGLTWVNGRVWKSDEQCQNLLQNSIIDWERKRNANPWGTTSHKPELVIYWQTIEVNDEIEA